MMMQKEKKLNFVSVMALIVTVVTVIIQILNPQTAQEKSQALFLFVSIMIYVGIAYFIVFVQDKVKFHLNEIKQNKEDIKELKKRLDITEKFSNFDKRLSLLEGKTK